MNKQSSVDIFINHDRGDATFEDLAKFVDEVRSRHPDKKDSDILMEMDDSLSNHESVNYFVADSMEDDAPPLDEEWFEGAWQHKNGEVVKEGKGKNPFKR